MTCGNTSDFIDDPLPKDFVSAHGASHHAWAPGTPPSKSGAARAHLGTRVSYRAAWKRALRFAQEHTQAITLTRRMFTRMCMRLRGTM